MANNGADLSITVERSNWLHAIESYIKVSESNCLNLESKGVRIEEVKSVLKLLPNSQVTNLILSINNLNRGMRGLSEFFKNSKITKLSLRKCNLSVIDFIHFMNILKDTLVTDLDVSWNQIKLNENRTREFIHYLRKSHLTVFNFGLNFCPRENTSAVLLARELLSTSIKDLHLEGVFKHHKSHDAIVILFSSLKDSAVQTLNLAANCISPADLKELGRSLRDSHLKTLVLDRNLIRDEGINFLFEALRHSQVVEVSLEYNGISTNNYLGHHLSDTKIRVLNLSGNAFCDGEIFAYPNFLRGSSVEVLHLIGCFISDEIGLQLMESLKYSKVTHLNLRKNGLELRSIFAFCETVKFTNIVEVDLSENFFRQHMLSTLGDCLITSKLRNIHLESLTCRPGFYGDVAALDFAQFVEKTKGSSLVSVNINDNRWNNIRKMGQCLENTTFTRFNLLISVVDLAPCLKFTAVTCLYLSRNDIDDKNAKILAESLKETQIVELDIGYNFITCNGAKAIALSLKDSKLLRLILSENNIKNYGLEFLAKEAKNTFITVLDVDGNPGDGSLLIDTVLWENRASTQRFVNTFKRITHEMDDNNLYFNENISNMDINVFLEECLFLYRSFVQLPSAKGVLEEENTISFSGAQIAWLLIEKFPQRFSVFIVERVEADMMQHIIILKKVEELGLSKIVEYLLLNRPLYTVDENLGILHPYVYKLMHKYKQPICNFSVEPYAKNKIMQYFLKNIHLEGASDIISLLRDGKI